MKRRDIVTSIILSIVTCGIYGIIWMINVTDEVSRVAEDPDMQGTKYFLYSLITCGIYTIIWAYKLGKGASVVKHKNSGVLSDDGVLYLILQLIGLNIVWLALAQSELNTYIDAQNK